MLKSTKKSNKYGIFKQANKLWLIVLAFVVVGATSFALSLKAITLDYDPLGQGAPSGQTTNSSSEFTDNAENGGGANNGDLTENDGNSGNSDLTENSANDDNPVEEKIEEELMEVAPLTASGTGISSLNGLSGKTAYLTQDITTSRLIEYVNASLKIRQLS